MPPTCRVVQRGIPVQIDHVDVRARVQQDLDVRGVPSSAARSKSFGWAEAE